jgi:glucose-1-phosphate thymidylyltransferase
MLSQGRRITALEPQGAWLDVVYPWDILRVNDIVLRRISPLIGGTIEEGVTIKGTVSIGKGSVIRRWNIEATIPVASLSWRPGFGYSRM